MREPSAFVAFLGEQLAPLGRISARPMFGAQGLYLDGLFIGLVVDEALYLKSDPQARARYVEAGCEPFRYWTRTGERTLAFYAPPEGAVDEQAVLIDWVREAQAAALRKAAGKRRR